MNGGERRRWACGGDEGVQAGPRGPVRGHIAAAAAPTRLAGGTEREAAGWRQLRNPTRHFFPSGSS